jgi:hypothetical protein
MSSPDLRWQPIAIRHRRIPLCDRENCGFLLSLPELDHRNARLRRQRQTHLADARHQKN